MALKNQRHRKTKRDHSKFFQPSRIRRYLIILLLGLIIFLISRIFFLMSVFIVFTLFIKFLKTLFPFPITPEPIVFFPILITMFWGLKFGVLFLFLVVVLFDLVIGRFNDATFVCFLMVLFICLLAVPLGHLIPSYFALGILLSFFYMMIYILIRTKILGIRIFDVLSPAISCFLFNYLYFSFLMPIVKPLMTIV